MDFREKTMTWDDMTAPMKSTNCTKEKNSHIAQHLYELSTEPNVLREAEDRQTRILAANYDQTDLSEFVKSLEHLNNVERQNLLCVFEWYPTLFQGGLGKLDIPPIHLEIQPGKLPHHARPYPVPKVYEELTKTEIKRLEGIGVLERNSDSEHAAPTFIQKKKTGDIRILTDFRKLNAMLIRKPHPLPKISDLLQKLTGFRWASASTLVWEIITSPSINLARSYVRW